MEKKIKRIVLHWTGGTYKPNSVDLKHYHFLIDDKGKVFKGEFSVNSNFVCKEDEKGNPLYAAHCGGGNTGAIGIAFCGMLGYKNFQDVGKYPLKKEQIEKGCEFIAKFCDKYFLNISSVQTHYEFGLANPQTSSKGKIDIVYLPPFPLFKANEIGDFLRSKIRWYYDRL